MSIGSNEKTADHLMNLVVTRNGDVPNFALLLGSGASATSGVRTAQDMIEEWRSLLYNHSGSTYSYPAWVATQDWFKHEDEYSLLFETVCDQPSQRRVYVEECVKDGHPNWGYVYLTNLLSSRFFDVVFTTNFDDLINEACYLYSDGLRPIVAAHDSAVQGIRVTARRPKIIKLHGDFLYDNIKNTLAELDTLEANTKRKLRQFAQEYGLVVAGYSGRDRSVMDTLDLLLRDEENFEQGVYWCLRRGDSLSARLQSLVRRDRVYLVEVDGFDEFMAELHRAAQLALPKPIARPFDIARDRTRLFVNVDAPLKSHPVISAHIRDVLGSINSHSPEIPLPLAAIRLSAMGEFNAAIPIWESAYNEDPDDPSIAYGYGEALADSGEYDKLVEFLQKAPVLAHNKTYLLLRAGRNQEVIDLATEVLTDLSAGRTKPDQAAIARINRAIAFKRMGFTDQMMDDVAFLEQHTDRSESNIRAGIAALKGDKEEMFLALKEAMHKTISAEQLRTFPVFEDYQDDPDFLKFANAAEGA